MTPARTQKKRPSRKTAEPIGCLSGFIALPLSAICVGIMMIKFISSDFTLTVFAPQPLSDTPLSSIFTDEVKYWESGLRRWSAAAGVDINLAATVMQIESCGDPSATSSAGAMGLFQVMPFHFSADELPYAPETNAQRGLGYLRKSLDFAQGNARLALAGYNGGIGVIYTEHVWANETQRYAYWGEGIYADALNGLETSPRLEEWFVTSGEYLCKQAHERLGLP